MNFNELSIHYLNKNLDNTSKYSEESYNHIIDVITDNEFNGSSINKLPDETKYLPNYSYICNNNIKELNINKVIDIGVGAFEACEQLVIVTGKQPVTIGEYTFSQCILLEQFEPILNNIPDNCFYNCKNLKGIYYAENVTSIGNDAFNGCYKLNNIGFNYNTLTNITNIGIRAFYNCISLTHIELCEGLVDIGAFAFSHCRLNKIIIPSTVKYIETEAFSDNLTLNTVVFNTDSNNEIYLNQNVFKNCSPNIKFINSNNNPYIDNYLKSIYK